MGVAFELRPEAKFNDGTPVTAEDVAWTFETLREKRPPLLPAVPTATSPRLPVEGPRRVVFHFKSNLNRELPLILGQMAVLPKHWWAGREFDKAADRPAARFRRLSGRSFRVRPHPVDGPRPRCLVEEPAGDARAGQFRHQAHRIFPRRNGRAGGIQGRPDRFPRGERRQGMGHRL